MAKLRVVEDFKISKSAIFGKEYKVSFLCPHCNTTLKVDEEDLGTPDICPSCHESYKLSPEVQDSIERERQRLEDTAREKQRLKEEAEANEHRCHTCGKKDSILDRLTSYDGGYYTNHTTTPIKGPF